MTESEIETKTKEILFEFNPEGISPFPYQVVEEKNKDLYVYEKDLAPNYSGVIIFISEFNKYTIILNKNKPQLRKNFTIGHELGHYFLHKDKVKELSGIVDSEEIFDRDTGLYRVDNRVSDELETEANRFAAALLMPSNLVVKAWNELHSIERCANIFQVSADAMSIRLVRLKLVQ